jgi:hypothetical protein
MNLLWRYLRFRTLFRALRQPLQYRSFWLFTVLAWLLNRRASRVRRH